MSNALPPPRIDLVVNAPEASALQAPLELLLEASSSLEKLLVPQLHLALQGMSEKPVSYSDLLKLAEEVVDGWSIEDQADFVSAHPRIGETKNLSALSGSEQGGVNPTPGEVLKRLSVSITFPCTRLV